MTSISKLFCAAGLLVSAVTGTASAQDDTIDAAARTHAIEELGDLIAAEYFDEELGAGISARLQVLARSATFAEITSGIDLAERLTADLQQRDRHFDIVWRGVDEIARTRAEWAAADAAAEVAANDNVTGHDRWASLRARNFAFSDLSVLDGNIGYLNLTGFAPIEPAEATARAALGFLAHTDAMIIDLRENHGGSPDMVQYLLSHFLPAGENSLYNTFIARNGERTEMRTLPDHPAGHRPDVPLYILVSPESLSAAEALAYHLQALGRARIIGEVTAGGGNPGDIFLAASGYSIFIATATSMNAVTGTNWDGVGVQPDIAVAAPDALDTALLAIYEQLADRAQDPGMAMMADWRAAWLEARLAPWQPDSAALQPFVGQYGPRRVWLEGGHLMYQREGREPTALAPVRPGTFRFADSLDYLIDFPDYLTGQASALAIRVEAGAAPPSPRSD